MDFKNFYGNAIWDLTVPFDRKNSLPIDRNSIFPSYDLAVKYAAKDVAGMAAEMTKLGYEDVVITNNAYSGQIIAVITDSDTTLYYIDDDMQLQEIGGKVSVDGLSIVTDTDGKLYLAGFAEAESATLPQKQSDGTIKWVPIMSIVEGDGNTVTTIETEDKALSVTAEQETNDKGAVTNIKYTVAVNVSAEEGNTVVVKDDGLYVEAYDHTKIEQDIQANAKAITDEINNRDKAINDAKLAIAKDYAEADTTLENKLNAEIVKKYEKPSTGIAKTDLASDVQASLGKADTALQAAALEPYETTDDAERKIAEAKGAVIGASTDASGANTIYGAKKYADEKAQEAIDHADQIKKDLLGEDGTLVGTYDTLKEIDAWINEHGVDTTNLTKAIADETSAREAADATLQKAIDDLKGTDHTHTNKKLLDSYTQTETDLADAVGKKHSHDNNDELDKIAAGDVEKWNKTQANLEDYVDQQLASYSTTAQMNGAISAEIGKLDVDDISGMGAGKTIATLTETDGKIAATFQEIKIEKTQINGFDDADYDPEGSAADALSQANSNINNAKLKLIGDADKDASTANTICGAKKYADEKVLALNTNEVAPLKQTVDNLAKIKSIKEGEFILTDAGELEIDKVAHSKIDGLDSLLNGKVDTDDGRLLTNDQKAKLALLEIKTEEGKDDKLVFNADQVEDLDDWVAAQRDAVTGLYPSLDATKLSGIEAGAQVNTIEVIQVAGSGLTIGDGKVVNIPLATANLAGLVKSATGENKVSVGSDGTMTVNSLNINKLVQTAGDVLILNGGNA